MRWLCHQAYELVGGECEHAEHAVTHHFRGATDPDVATAELPRSSAKEAQCCNDHGRDRDPGRDQAPSQGGVELLCLVGPPGVGKTSLAWLVAAALGRVHAWVACGELSRAADVHGARSGPPGRIVGELRRVGVRNPVFILDGIDRLDDGGGAAAALHEALAPMPGAAFRDRYVDLPFDLSDALFVATANRLTPVPAGLREAMTVVEVPGYAEAEKRAIAAGHLLPLQLARHGLTAGQVRVTEEAVDAIVRGHTRETGVWGLADAPGTVCAKVVRRRAEGDEAPAEVTPQALAGMLGRTGASRGEGRRPYGAAGRGGRTLLDGGRRRRARRRGQPHARLGRAGPDRPVGEDDARAPGPGRPGHDGRDHPLRPGASRRRHPGQGADRAPLRPDARHPAPPGTASRSTRCSATTSPARSKSTT